MNTKMVEPPRFQEAAFCDVCKGNFGAFKRRHHCRCCGRSLCSEHSSNQLILPQFGLNFNVRVCDDCFNTSTRSGKSDCSASAANDVTDSFSNLTMSQDNFDIEETESSPATIAVPECKCGMPLCICPPPSLPTKCQQVTSPSPSTSQSITRPKKVTTKATSDSLPTSSAASSSKSSPFFSMGQSATQTLDNTVGVYEKNGEGLREAIKNTDLAAVRRLLDEGVDANFSDKQGMSLLHLAALFNQTEVVFLLMDHGANLESKNAQGETPLDCAPVTLQYKMREKLKGNI